MTLIQLTKEKENYYDCFFVVFFDIFLAFFHLVFFLKTCFTLSLRNVKLQRIKML